MLITNNILCTISDYNYLAQGLTLYDSLNQEYPLHYLCLDDKAYNFLQNKQYPYLKAYKGTRLFPRDPNLPYCNAGGVNKFSHYCYSLSSRFTRYLLTTKKVESVTYLDSDLFFLKPISHIFKEMGNASIGLVSHDSPENKPEFGKYNVGLVYFKNDLVGHQALKLWEDCVMDPDHKLRAEYGTLGDQKYLETFELKWKEHIKIVGSKNGAPYNFHTFSNQDNYHFIHFMQYRSNGKGYDPVGKKPQGVHWAEGNFMKIPGVKKLYDEYNERINEYETLL